ncbi:tyrosine-type recombinase/integrase [Nonomuraea sp. CA-218870]|uniref:tyrosine-type recombinase/integrase n=1 Tax=Nonomuraea sp. CA-218870 TaxID=3239998 RepID=UPI003D8B6213
MAIYDRWHKTHPKAGDPRCSCKPARAKTRDHGCKERWQVRWRDEDGNQKKESFAKLPTAELRDAEIRASLANGSYVDPHAGAVTLAEYGRRYVANMGCDPQTAYKARMRLEMWAFSRPIGKLPIGALAKTPSRIQQWLKEQEPHLAPSTIQLNAISLGAIFNAAIDDRIISRNPFKAKSVRVPKPEERKVVPLTLAQVQALDEALPDWYEGFPYIGAGCGLRQGELLGLALEDIDFLGRVVHVRRQVKFSKGRLVFALPKYGKMRDVPLPDFVGLRVSSRIQRHKPVPVTLPWRIPEGKPVTASLLFTSRRGDPMWGNNVGESWRLARRKAGVPSGREFGTHVLRHTAASAWLASGVDIKTVSEYLGHFDPGFTLRTYVHMMPNASERARSAMNLFFQDQNGPCAPEVPGDAAV